MALKRKRSSPAFSSPSSDTSDATTQASPLPFFYHHSKPVEPIYSKPAWSWPTYDDSPAHLNSRTRKRHRSRTRQEEEQTHAKTISKLYDAQRQHPNASPVLSQQVATPPETHVQRSTLHSFWRLGRPPVAMPMVVDVTPGLDRSMHPRCEDCDRDLQSVDAMDVDDIVVEQETRCQGCLRQVCDMCAVLGDRRICLGCARNGH
ncbi:hypothetical protein Slin15195_G005800 [Septoria linicola]|uniref:Uncharacterized protein n=1 Tax=Septoria linicola TaxID=215465 RepID=A0A9Q9AM07_9PEZI|nr:hypothetical protein Slin14017_G005840 [Septoria linicola]USW47261.1 hypothetical protein Slin15195_G005800 [Septoria linicola]